MRTSTISNVIVWLFPFVTRLTFCYTDLMSIALPGKAQLVIVKALLHLLDSVFDNKTQWELVGSTFYIWVYFDKSRQQPQQAYLEKPQSKRVIRYIEPRRFMLAASQRFDQ